MIVINTGLLAKCREYGLKTIHEINVFVKKHMIESNEELEHVMNGDHPIYTITVREEDIK